MAIPIPMPSLFWPDIIVALLDGLPTSPHFLLIPFYPLASICFLLKFVILMMQRRVRNHAREMVLSR
jgi:hypothetical protein